MKTGRLLSGLSRLSNHNIRKKKNMEGKNDPEQELRHSVNKDPDDIELFFHSGQGFSEGKRVHFGRRGFYHTADHTVYIETWGPGENKVESYQIPDKAGKTRDELLQYLKGKNVFIPL